MVRLEVGRYISISSPESTFSVNSKQCSSSSIVGVEFDNFYSCITEGYKYSYTRLKELPEEEIEEKLLAIKFECRKVETPKINT